MIVGVVLWLVRKGPLMVLLWHLHCWVYRQTCDTDDSQNSYINNNIFADIQKSEIRTLLSLHLPTPEETV